MAKKKKEKKGGKRMKKKELVETLISYIRTKPFEAFSLKQLFQGLNLTTHPLKMLCADTVQEMVEDNFLIEVEKGKYKLNDKGQILTGTFQRKSNGKNSFIPEDGGEPIFIAERNSAHAMNNMQEEKPGRSGHRDSGTCQYNLRRNSEGQQELCFPADGNQYPGQRYLHPEGQAERR